METDILYFYDPSSPVIGKLSNNYIKPLYVNEEIYKSVSHYIYSQLLPEFADDINQIQNPELLNEAFTTLYDEKLSQILKVAIKKALEVKIQNPEFRKILQTTGTRALIYDSPNPLLGRGGESRNGKNIYGNSLMELRDQMGLSLNLEKYEFLYDIYNTIFTLREKILSGSSLLEEYVSSEVVPSKSMEYQLFVELLRNGNLPDIDILRRSARDPRNIVPMLQQKYITQYLEKIETQRKLTTLNVYLTSIIKNKYPKVKNVDLAISQQLSKLDSEQKTELIERLHHLYDFGLFPQEISDRIDKLYILPSMEIIDKIKEYVPTGSDYDFQQLEPESETEPILFFEPTGKWTQLSPRYTELLYIDRLPYPSISHYLTFNMLLSIPVETNKFNLFRSMILINPKGSQTDLSNYKNIQTMGEMVVSTEEKLINIRKKKLLITALNSKFSQTEKDMVELLLSTGDSYLVYNDPNDPYLGIGKDNSGENTTGQVLEQMRKTIDQPKAASPRLRKFDKKPRQVLESYLRYDKSTIDWVKMRMEDICRVINVVNDYLNKLLNRKINVEAELVKFVVDSVYKTCGSSELDRNPMPLDFMDEASRYIETNIDIASALWEYIDKLVINLRKYKPVNTDTKKYVGKITNSILSGKPDTCVGPYRGDFATINLDNCIIQAILTIRDSIGGYVSDKYNLDESIDLDEDLLNCILSIISPGGVAVRYNKNIKLNEQDENALKYLPSLEPRESIAIIKSFTQTYTSGGMTESKITRLLFFTS